MKKNKVKKNEKRTEEQNTKEQKLYLLTVETQDADRSFGKTSRKTLTQRGIHN